jgi:single-strand selective monofunctional uracil DNA glycosylase
MPSGQAALRKSSVVAAPTLVPEAVAATLEHIARDLVRALGPLEFAEPVTHVYNPLVYAWEAHAAYLKRYGAGPKEVLLVGMNPGPFGMAQTGVPFGEVAAVRDWLSIQAPIGRPSVEHPARPIEGLACAKSEVSGARLWGWAREHFGTPEAFFARFLVVNYCPLAFMEESGKNFTPDKLPKAERAPLFEACDAALRRTVVLLEPRVVVGVGKFAADRARVALQGLDVHVGTMLHPSPASPAANKGWAAKATAELTALGIRLG